MSVSSNLKSLISKLNRTCKNALEGAAGLCVSRTHYQIDVEHVLLKLVEFDDTDVHRIAHQYEMDIGRINRDLTDTLDGFKSGSSRTPVFSPNLTRLIEQAWLLSSIDYNGFQVRSGHLLLGLLGNSELSRLIKESSKEFVKISKEDLEKRFTDITAGSPEERQEESSAFRAGTAAQPTGAEGLGTGKAPGLEQFTLDLTERAAQGLIDPVVGRDREIRQMIDILMRRRQNNPILTGEAGVGKTAVVEGLALRLARKDVPEPLQNVVLRSLDLGLLQAGASVKGEFENRLKSVIDEVKSSPQPIVLFIDEAHTMIGAGGAPGQSDAANLLKPALARGELRTIAATTWSEYKKYFEKDAALARRFQVVKVDEPIEEQACSMLRSLVGNMERHHNVRILNEALVDAVRLSHRYLSGRQLPDKAVSVLDTACSRVAVSRASEPAAVEDARRSIERIGAELEVLRREHASSSSHSERLAELEDMEREAGERLATLEDRWASEKRIVERITEVRGRLEQAFSENPSGDDEQSGESEREPEDRKAFQQELTELTTELLEFQGESPLLQVCVNSQSVAEVIAAWTGIPLGKMLKDEIRTVLSLKEHLCARVIGQDHALDTIAQRIRTARARLDDPAKPIGVFMLAGPSGVGKTETALAMADVLYGGERNLVTINMSEYQEAHTVSGLKGSPPGYVGYGEGGVLTEAVRRKPYSVVLLDEVEKAHPDVLELFYQVFDKGFMDDAEGREIDFRNTVIFLTTNVGTDIVMDSCMSPEVLPEPDSLLERLYPSFHRVFKPAFVGRTVLIPYYPIRDEIMVKIVELKLGKIKRRFSENHNAELVYDDSLIREIANRCTEVDTGARNVDHILTGTLLPEISEAVLAKMAAEERIATARVSVGEDGGFVYDVQ